MASEDVVVRCDKCGAKLLGVHCPICTHYSVITNVKGDGQAKVDDGDVLSDKTDQSAIVDGKSIETNADNVNKGLVADITDLVVKPNSNNIVDANTTTTAVVSTPTDMKLSDEIPSQDKVMLKLMTMYNATNDLNAFIPQLIGLVNAVLTAHLEMNNGILGTSLQKDRVTTLVDWAKTMEHQTTNLLTEVKRGLDDASNALKH